MFKCSACEYTDKKFFGLCPTCKEGLGEEFEETDISSLNKFSKKTNKKINKNKTSFQQPTNIKEIDNDQVATRLDTKDNQLNNIFGGKGITENSVTLLSGEPGVGKSTLLLQLISALSDRKRTLYLSGEESKSQIKNRYNRLKLKGDLDVLNDTNLSNLLAMVDNYDLLIIDSINTMYLDEVEGSPGGVTQIKATTHTLVELAKQYSKTIIIIGQINKDGSVAGPKALEHIVDTVLSFEDFDDSGKYKLLSPVKNRFGSLLETGIYQMEELGLIPVTDPSMILIDQEEENNFGSALSLIRKGKRPFFVNVEALVDVTKAEKTYNQSIGFDQKRLMQILTISSKYLKLFTGDKNVFVSLAGQFSLKSTESSLIDLATISAILSSTFEIPISKDCIFLGEVGLNGAIRPSAFEAEFIKFATNINPNVKIISRHTNYKHITDIFDSRNSEFKF